MDNYMQVTDDGCKTSGVCSTPSKGIAALLKNWDHLYDAQLNACFGNENSLVCFAKGVGGAGNSKSLFYTL